MKGCVHNLSFAYMRLTDANMIVWFDHVLQISSLTLV